MDSRNLQEDPVALMRRAKTGDKEAFGKLYTIYFTPIYRYVAFRVSDKEEAENLVQNVFLKVYASLGNFTLGNAPPIAYFFTVARNIIIDFWRKKKDVRIEEDNEIFLNIPDTQEGPERVIEKQEHTLFIKNALRHLTQEQQEIITLKFINELANKEIAELTGKSEDAIRQLQSRALKTLRHHLGNYGEA